MKKVETYIAENGKDEKIDGLLPLLKALASEREQEWTSVSKESQQLDAQKKALQEFDDASEQQKQELGALRDYLNERQIDAELVNLLPEMNGYANDVDRHHKESVRLQGEISSRQKSLDGVVSEREKALANLTTLQNEKESIIQEDIPVVVAELRHTLKPGEPCPVCGSREHLSCDDSAKVENGADRLNDFAAKLRKINGEMEKVQRALDGFATQQQNFEELIRESSQKEKDEAGAEKSSLELLNAKLEP